MEADDRRALRDAARSCLKEYAEWTADQHVESTKTGFDRSRWKLMAEQAGLQGVRIDERWGGAGLGLSAELIVHEEMGRALYSGPYFGVAQVAAALSEMTDDPANHERLAAIAAGDLIAVPALPIEETFPLEYPEVIRSDSNVLELSGSLPCIVDAQIADALLVLADFEGFHAFFWVDTTAPGVQISPLETVDLTRRMSSVSFDRVPVEVVAQQDRARAAVAAVRQGTALALSAECVGLATRALELTVEYVKVRSQFGQLIGSFQAVKHSCADLFVGLEAARSALVLATRGVETNDMIGRRPESLAGLAVARMYCGRIAFDIANESIHLHGGIGFTWEHRAHLYYRRAKSNQSLLDSTGRQARLLTSSVLAMHQAT
ncbi:acyl-CoA dehydrogenase family protein [Aeromicrobium panaciterrae]|uniref:acyl-CoA dehydrogenase family protein n=1 Tax=Aeromicrobium panaciterrae TaxID=363861 RepID=UPI0031DB9A79